MRLSGRRRRLRGAEWKRHPHSVRLRRPGPRVFHPACLGLPLKEVRVMSPEEVANGLDFIERLREHFDNARLEELMLGREADVWDRIDRNIDHLHADRVESALRDLEDEMELSALGQLELEHGLRELREKHGEAVVNA